MAEVSPNGLQRVLEHFQANKVDGFLWIVRVVTVIFTIIFMIPVFGVNPYNAFYKALIANAATSALRLHQRLPRVQLNRQFLAILLLEDSFHYLFYSLIFIYCYPTTLVLFPVFFFALLHSSCYFLVLLEKVNAHSTFFGQTLQSLKNRQRKILKLVSYIEILLMLIVVSLMINGKGSLMTVILYYHFLSLRYSSRRNPYTRTVFHELRILLESFANRNTCPNFLRNIIMRMINFLTRIAPAVPLNGVSQ